MARNRTIGRQTAQSRPAASPPSDAHSEYKAMLAGDFGDPSFKPMALEDGRPGGAFSLLHRPVGLFLLACMAFVIVLGAKLYRDGLFDHLWAPEAKAPPPDRNWILGDRMRVPESDAAARDEDAAEAAPQSADDEGKSTDKKVEEAP
ncbi:MAG: hypothetical protein ACKVOP_14280 [Sphingomonadaceae bacterium]